MLISHRLPHTLDGYDAKRLTERTSHISNGHMSTSRVSADLKKKASRVRKQFERGAIPPFVLAGLYDSYNPVTEITRFVSVAQEIFPRLSCGLASTYLRQLLQKGVVVNGTYEGNGHTFLLIDDCLVVDITADQFGGPKVYVGPLQIPWSKAKAEHKFEEAAKND